MKTVSYSGYKLNEDSQLQWLQINGRQLQWLPTQAVLIKSRTIQLTDLWHVEGIQTCLQGFCGETGGKGNNHAEDQGVDGRIPVIGKAWTGFIHFRTGTSRLLLRRR
jgi:hypothetical protein